MPTRFRNFCTYIECATPTVVSKFVYSKKVQCSARPVCNVKHQWERVAQLTRITARALGSVFVMSRANWNRVPSGRAVQRSTVERRCVHATVQHCTAAVCRAACDAIFTRM